MGIVLKQFVDIDKMTSEEIRLEMLQIWHDVDFNILTDEEREQVKDNLRLYREILLDRHYSGEE